MYDTIHDQSSAAGNFINTAHGRKVQTAGSYENVKHIAETPFTIKHNMAYSTTTHTSATAAL